MRLSNAQAVARPVYYDRNPILRMQNYNVAGVAPHGETVRWTYTVPAGKKAFVDVLFSLVRRASVATTNATANVTNYLTPSGGSAVAVANSSFNNNGVGTTDKLQMTQFGPLGTGDAIDGRSSDTSTGGTVDYLSTGKIYEFDA